MVSFRVSIIITSAVMTALAITAVVLRFWAQNKVRKGLHSDDYCIVAGLLLTIGTGIITIYGADRGGFGQPLVELSPATAVLFAKLLFAHQFFWTTSVAVIKISLLLFYKRIFDTPKLKLAANVLIVGTICWWIAFIFGTLFSATPIEFQWTQVGTYNINYPAFLIASGVTDFVFDVAILVLPLTVINRLQINQKKKYFLIGVFGLGLFCIVTAIARIVYFVRASYDFGTPDVILSMNTANLILWSDIGPCISVVTACLPLYGPLARQAANSSAVQSFTSSFKKGSSAQANSRGNAKNWSSWNERSGESRDAKKAWEPIVHTGNSIVVSHGDASDIELAERGSIRVESSVHTY